MENKRLNLFKISQEAKWLLFFCLFCGAFIFILGNYSDLYLGDETFHYRLAEYIFKADFKRPLFDPLALTNPVGNSYYVDPMGWHYLLALIWKILGQISKISAQIYQTSWYLILIIFTYLLGKEFRDKKTGLFAAILIATTPFAAALSIILHTDIPVAAASAATVYLLIRRKIFLASLACVAMTYIKRNSYMLLPAIIVISLCFVLQNRRGIVKLSKGFLRWIIVFILPICILIAPEAIYRYMTFGIHSFWSGDIIRPVDGFKHIDVNLLTLQNKLVIKLDKVNIPLAYQMQNKEVSIIATQPKVTAQVIKTPLKPKQSVEINIAQGKSNGLSPSVATLTTTKPLLITPELSSNTGKDNDSFKKLSERSSKVIFNYSDTKKVSFFDESNFLIDPAVLLKYFGLGIVIGLFLYFMLLAGKRRDFILWLLVLTYLPIYFYVFKLGLNMRYLSPILVFLAVIGGIGISKIKYSWIKKFLCIVCIIQLFAVGIYAFNMRKVPIGLKQAYTYIRGNTMENARVMCSKNALSLYSDRYSIWLGVPSLHELNYLFWQAKEKEMLEIFKKYEINYILVEKDKMYDDSSIRHTGGYPNSFVAKLRSGKIFDLCIENDEAALWKINQNKGNDNGA